MIPLYSPPSSIHPPPSSPITRQLFAASSPGLAYQYPSSSFHVLVLTAYLALLTRPSSQTRQAPCLPGAAVPEAVVATHHRLRCSPTIHLLLQLPSHQPKHHHSHLKTLSPQLPSELSFRPTPHQRRVADAQALFEPRQISEPKLHARRTVPQSTAHFGRERCTLSQPSPKYT